VKILIDTNVLVSAALKDGIPEAVIEFVAARPDIEWIVSMEILKEYEEVLARPKFGLAEDVLRDWRELIESLTTTILVELEVDFPRDAKDAKFLACALASGADYLVTGDRDFTEAQKLVTTTILSASAFKRLICDVS
jgi:putative PIN family toxin of toxin-antitoxin system